MEALIEAGGRPRLLAAGAGSSTGTLDWHWREKLDIQNRNSFCPAEPADSTIDFYFAIVKRTPLSDN